MSQHLYVNFRDGYGERDYTPFLTEFGRFTLHELNRPALMDFTLMPVGDTTHWRVPERGALIRFEDTTWRSRFKGVRDGVIFSGYLTGVPTVTQLGDRLAYKCEVTSEDYLSNIHPAPALTYVDKSRGYIIKDMLRHIFKDAFEFPYNLDLIEDGGNERFYQVDPTKKFTDLVAAFAVADSFVYSVVDGFFIYAPQAVFMEQSADPTVHVVLDALDPRYTAANLNLKRIDNVVANDVTVLGNDEAGNTVREHFISDGYSGTLPLSFIPYGSVEQVIIDDDMTSDTINESVWFEQDVANYIRPFQGSLNIVGGSSANKTSGIEFLRSTRGVDLSGILTFRDGEIFFPPVPSGVGIIGGLYTSAGASMDEGDLLLGW